MAEAMQGLVGEAKKNRFSSLANHSLSDEDVVSVWDNVSSFIEKQMSAQKGVTIPGLGTFTFSQKKLDVGNNKFILIQRPVFVLAEKFAQTHGLNSTKLHTTGQIPIVQLNFAALAHESPFDRDTVEACVKEVMNALARSVANKRNVEFSFAGIGRLSIRDSKVKMKFYKDFINCMDGSGKLVEALKDLILRPGTGDSVMSECQTPVRPGTNTLILPRISNGGLALGPNEASMPTIREEAPQAHTPPIPGEGGEQPSGEELEACKSPVGALEASDPDPAHEYDIGLRPMDGANDLDSILDTDDDRLPGEPRASAINLGRGGSRMAVPMAQASGVNFAEDLLPPQPTVSPKGYRGTPRSSLSPIHLPRSATLQTPNEFAADRPEYRRSASMGQMEPPSPPVPGPPKVKLKLPHIDQQKALLPQPPSSSCGHQNAGQELCYLCHQRERRNIPDSFAKERRKREEEEDRLLQQYQHMKDTDAILQQQEGNQLKRYDNQKMAAFNLGVSEAINQKKFSRSTDFHPSYIFQKRPLTPPRFIKQELYHNDLAQQVLSKEEAHMKRRADEDFLERLEQVQLAEDLAAQREQYLKEKSEQHQQYKRALSAQIKVRDNMRAQNDKRPGVRHKNRLRPLTLPSPQIIVPFQQAQNLAVQEGPHSGRTTVRFKPLQLPARVPDSSEPVFGRFDMTNEEMAERRARAHNLYKEQLSTVEQRKRDAILRRLTEQKQEEEMLHRTKNELLEDRADRFERMHLTRTRLEDDWFKSRDLKKAKEHEENERNKSPGALLHEQCDKYNRCTQCKRRVGNCGESNIWRESRYIPGSRLMV